MVIWGACWGAFIGWIMGKLSASYGFFHDVYWVFGAIFGSIAGLTLRIAVRTQIKKLQLQSSASIAKADSLINQVNTQLLPTPPTIDQPVETSIGEFLQEEESVPVTETAIAAELASKISPTISLEATQTPTKTNNASPNKPAFIEPNFLEKAISKAIAWLFGGNTVVRLGIVVLFIGLVFLAKYAADNAMFPIEFRLAIVGLVGIALLVIGFKVRDKKMEYGMSLQGAGVAVMYLTIFASYRLYQLMPAGMAFALMGAVCALSALIAVLQNSRSLAVIGFAGGFLAPVLTSTGQGSHIALFSYYAMLNIAIVFIAGLSFKQQKSWRLLNIVGFFATFGVATAWGVLKYIPQNYATTQPFLILFFVLFTVTAILHARAQATQIKSMVDGTLVFGTPLVVFGLQVGLVQPFEYGAAYSALAMASFYIVLAWGLLKASNKQSPKKYALLIESFLVLGVGFMTLAVPLAFDASWTAATWAIEGASMCWLGHRQHRWFNRAAGLLLQGLAAISFFSTSIDSQVMSDHYARYPFANASFIGALLLSLSAIAIAWWAFKNSLNSQNNTEHLSSSSLNTTPWESALIGFEKAISAPLYLVGFFWWFVAFNAEIQREIYVSGGNVYGSYLQSAIPSALHANLTMLLFVVSAFLSLTLGLKRNWPVATWPARYTMPVMLIVILFNMVQGIDVVHAYSWIIWPVCLYLHFNMLKKIDEHANELKPKNQWFTLVHTLGAWLVVIMLANLLMYLIRIGSLGNTAWATVAIMISATFVLLGLTFWTRSNAANQWPLKPFMAAYLWRAALPMAALVYVGAIAVAIGSSGNTKPLPYIPLLNPVEITIALALAGLVLWILRLKTSGFALPAWVTSNKPKLLLMVAIFIAINTVWLRIVHHFLGVVWDASALFNSDIVQMGYAILWTLMALGLMLMANKKRLLSDSDQLSAFPSRQLWLVGAALLGLTLVKLMLIDLSHVHGVARIVTFIGVGVLMLVVGYFAPLPAKSTPEHHVEKV